jgi:hypothetical protein
MLETYPAAPATRDRVAAIRAVAWQAAGFALLLCARLPRLRPEAMDHPALGAVPSTGERLLVALYSFWFLFLLCGLVAAALLPLYAWASDLARYDGERGFVLRGLISGHWKYIHTLVSPRLNQDELGDEELYDLTTDPGESLNQIGDRTEIGAALRARLDRLIAEQQAGALPREPLELDAETLRMLQALGYLEEGA